MQPITLYKTILKEFGEQNWWPVTEPGETAPTYKKRKSLSTAQRFEICVGAILTQNTSWLNVMKALENLNKAKMLSPRKLGSARKRKTASLIKPAGYFNQKAGYLKNFSAHLEKNYAGKLEELFKKPSAELRKELLSIKGIGEETADSIILYSAQKPVFVVDAYTKRVLSRLRGERQTNSSYVEVQSFFESRLPKNVKLFNEFHALFVALGKDFCTKTSPGCFACCLRRNCAFPSVKP